MTNQIGHSTKAEEAIAAHTKPFEPTLPVQSKIQTPLTPQSNSPQQDVQNSLALLGTEHSVEQAFALEHAGRLKYNHDTKQWFKWNGQFWAVDSTGIVPHYCRLMSVKAEASYKQTHKKSFAVGVERHAISNPVFATTSVDFDRDNYLLNTPAGTYDLRTGEYRQHDPYDSITHITLCQPAEVGNYGKHFPSFLNEITCGDEELKSFLQVALGACLSGAIEEHYLIFLIGSGRNGKNTFGDVIMHILHTYAKKIPANVLTSGKHERHPAEIANLRGCRLAIASEIEHTANWNEPRVNELTGDAKLSARWMGGNPFEFKRTHKFLIYANNRPRLNNITPALKSRIKMVPFDADFSQNPDPDLANKLLDDKEGILRWLMDGHAAWIANNRKLPSCQKVDSEMDDYLSSQATPYNFIDEYLRPSNINWVSASELYTHYSRWKNSRGEHPVSQTIFSESLKFEKKRTNKGWVYGCEWTTGCAPFPVSNAPF